MTFVGFWFQAIVDRELHAHLNKHSISQFFTGFS